MKKENRRLLQEDKNKRDAALCSADQQLTIKDQEIRELKANLQEQKDIVKACLNSSPADDDRERIQVLEQQVNISNHLVLGLEVICISGIKLHTKQFVIWKKILFTLNSFRILGKS